MSSLTKMNPSDFVELLGGDCPGYAADGTGNQINPDPGKRVIFVGLGGSGLRTLEEIKKWVTEHMMPNWEHCIGFLGLDSDWRDAERLRYLNREELVIADAPGMAALHGTEAAWPGAWRFTAQENQIRHVHPNGHINSRLRARLQLRCSGPGGVSGDLRFRMKLQELIHTRMFAFGGHYEVYVIAGLAGSFGSAIAPEMAALIRRTLAGTQVQVQGIFYTPDLYFPLDPQQRDWMASNGFAALKELNYIEELKNRPGEVLCVSSSDPADGFRILAHGADAGYDTVTLMGANHHPALRSKAEAIENVTSQMISVLLDHMPHPRSGIATPMPTKPAQDYPAAMDFATADAVCVGDCPELIWAWHTARICEKAGFSPISDQERANRIAAGDTFLPFLGKNQLLPAQEVDQMSRELLHPLLSFMGHYQTCDFRYAEVISGGAPTWEMIRDGHGDGASVRAMTDRYVQRSTSSEELRRLTDGVREEFRRFRSLAEQYMMQYGPLAFVNLYFGRGIPGENGDYPRGIRDMLHMLVDDVNPMRGTPMSWPRAEELWYQCQMLGREITETGSRLTGRLIMQMGKGEALAAQWTDSYEQWVNARINELRRQMMLGKNGILYQEFLKPAEKLVEQMRVLGNVLTTMTEINGHHAAPLASFTDFSHWAANRRDGTACALCREGYEVLMDELDQLVAMTSPAQFRMGVLRAFLDNPEEWLDFSDRFIRTAGYRATLANPRNPIPARQFFDRTVENLTGSCDIPLTKLIWQMMLRGIPLNHILNILLRELYKKRRPGITHGPGGPNRVQRLLYPQNLDLVIGPGTSMLLSNIAQNVFGNVACLPTEDLTGLRLVTMELGLEARQAADVRPWRDAYRHRLHFFANGLHGLGPGQYPAREGGFPWETFPDLVDGPDPESTEQRDRVQDLTHQARSMGLLRCRNSAAHGGWEVSWLDMGGVEEPLFQMLDTLAHVKLFPLLGTDAWSWRDFEHGMKPLRMDQFGVYGQSAPSEEEAWKKAEQLLRIFPELRNRLETQTGKLAQWLNAWPDRHPGYQEGIQLRVLLWALASGVLRKEEYGIWEIEDQSGRGLPIANHSESGLHRLCVGNPELAEYVRKGMMCRVLFHQFTEKLDAEDLAQLEARAEDQLMTDEWEFEEEIPKRMEWIREECEWVLRERPELRTPEKTLEIRNFYERIRSELREFL